MLEETDGKETLVMKTATKLVVVAVFVTMVWPTVGNAGELGRRWCGPLGTWIGANATFEQEYLVSIQPLSGNCFSVVSEGLEVTLPWEVATSWRGVVRKIDRDTFTIELVTFAGPSQLTDPGEGVPDIAAIRGQLNMLDCDHFEIEFDEVLLYAWGQMPFEDDPVATMPPSVANYARVPFNCTDRAE
jgi:hypothetical protein